MPSVFTRILEGDLPGHVVWKDDICFAILSIHPLRKGHTLLIPREEFDHWLDMPAEVSGHLFAAAPVLGRALFKAFEPVKVGLMIAGLEVPHAHVHLVPIDDLRDLDFGNAQADVDHDELNQAARAIRSALRSAGRREVCDE